MDCRGIAKIELTYPLFHVNDYTGSLTMFLSICTKARTAEG